MDNTAIKVENLSKLYHIGQRESYYAFRDAIVNLFKPSKQKKEETVWALKDISFEINCGDAVGVIGRNGAGKSTLLKVLSRITVPTKGRARIRGRAGSLLEVGTGFHPELTGRENIYLYGAILGMKRIEIHNKFDEIVCFSGVERFIDTPIKHYSSGMYVRLAFSVAAHLEHEILLVDEVLAVGDHQFQKKCLGKMEGVAKEGRTILFVSHNMAAVNLLCKKAMLIEKGSISFYGETKDCIDKYISVCGERRGKILDHQIIKDPALKVTNIKVNEFLEDSINITSTEEPLEVKIEFISNSPCRVSLFALLKDKQGQDLAIYSPGHMNGEIYSINSGHYNISGKIYLPKLNKGQYFLDLSIVYPGVKHFVYFPFAAELQVGGYPSKVGLVFKQGVDAGYQVLTGNCLLNGKNNLEG